MKQQGFTLIELIIVIVILGILAVTAAPKFIDIQSDATASTLQGAKAAMQGGAQLVYAKSAIAGEQNGAGNANIGAGVTTSDGYPDADAMTTAMLSEWVELPSAEWTLVEPVGADATAAGPADGGFGIHPDGATVDFEETGTDGASCHVLYTNSAGGGASPVITVVAGSC
ncbi:prepilin-type N-terminal cleavage/methylation domain-containing protein [Lacimicrobium alkaliphilum]|uniref:Type IV pilin n=1 Tax=Lacimicrobium alkaliphilum TaxID=1526571 RepID=A0ABQ1RAD0_9ALTE|nr:prepilin-type N-terminal cleavage/methylation domain-containing protein [Lacimicrobium alkaliphilum]GGD61883.1 type IV pilin [Lacimicrobium alkaliphilum]